MRPTITALAGLVACAFVAPATAATYTVQTSFNAGDFSTQYLTEHWLPKIAEMTGGRVEIALRKWNHKYLRRVVGSDTPVHVALTPNGSVVPAKETPHAVGLGVIDGDWTSVNYFSGLEPAFAILGDLISGYDTPQQMAGFCENGPGEAVWQKALDEVSDGEAHLVGCAPYSREALPARVPIRTFDDLKGKKIRAPEGLASAVFQAAGASPVSIPFSEVYGALEKGIVDAADASAYVNNASTGLNDVARYPLYPGIHSMPSMQLSFNREKWEALSEADRMALRDWFYMAMADLTRVVAEQDAALAAKDAAAPKVPTVVNTAHPE